MPGSLAPFPPSSSVALLGRTRDGSQQGTGAAGAGWLARPAAAKGTQGRGQEGGGTRRGQRGAAGRARGGVLTASASSVDDPLNFAGDAFPSFGGSPSSSSNSISNTPFLEVRGVQYQPPGAHETLLQDVSFDLAQNSLGLLVGRSGTGKTTLMHLLAGFSSPTKGEIVMGGKVTTSEDRVLGSGMVFQFPERHFLTGTVLEELTFGWPKRPSDAAERQRLAQRLNHAVEAVKLNGIAMDTPPSALSDGYKRRLALAVQLARAPKLLLLDEPLAGLDWRARRDLVDVLLTLKSECTILAVSHDLQELAPLTDKMFRMEDGGKLAEDTPNGPDKW